MKSVKGCKKHLRKKLLRHQLLTNFIVMQLFSEYIHCIIEPTCGILIPRKSAKTIFSEGKTWKL